jgi:hypothetical protein
VAKAAVSLKQENDMEMSLDPEISLAQTMCLAAGIPLNSLVSGVIDREGYFVPPDRTGFADERIAGSARVYAWRRFSRAARKAHEIMARNGQHVLYKRPHFFHGDHEPYFGYVVDIFPDKGLEICPEKTVTGGGNDTLRFNVYARSEREAISLVFDSIVRPPLYLRLAKIQKSTTD